MFDYFKQFYVNVEYYERSGNLRKKSSEDEYGFNHTIIEIKRFGPAFFSKEYNDNIFSCIVNDYDKNIDWESLKNSQVYVVYMRYATAGTFELTEGIISILYVAQDLKEAKRWAKQNHKRYEEKYNGAGSGFSMNCQTVDFILKEYIQTTGKNWWNEE